jgi:gluconate 2-dehydrogenase gamma chain
MDGTTRRELLAAITVAAAPGLQAQHAHETGLVQLTGPYKPKALTAGQMTWLGKLADAIVPRTETPGASDAGVPAFIDRRVAGDPLIASQVRKGIELLDAEAMKRFQLKFPALDTGEVTEILTGLEAAPDTEAGAFFLLMKGLTVEGYYTSQEGLVRELGWHGNTYLTEFAGCTHPEHQS